MPIKDINFTSAQGKKRKLEQEIHKGGNDEATVQQTVATGKKYTESEMETLFVNKSHYAARSACEIKTFKQVWVRVI